MSDYHAVLAGDFLPAPRAAHDAVATTIAALSAAVAGAGWANILRFETEPDGSWRLIMDQPHLAMRLAVVLRAALRSDENNLDTRVAVGAGDVSPDDRPDFTSLPAHRAFDTLQSLKRGRHLGVAVAGMPQACQAIAPLLDALCQQWTECQAKPLALKLHPDAPTQTVLAQEFGISAQSLNRRLHLARWREIEAALRVIESHPPMSRTHWTAMAM